MSQCQWSGAKYAIINYLQLPSSRPILFVAKKYMECFVIIGWPLAPPRTEKVGMERNGAKLDGYRKDYK